MNPSTVTALDRPRRPGRTTHACAFAIFTALVLGLLACSKPERRRTNDTRSPAPTPQNTGARPSARTIDLRRDALSRYKRLWEPLAAWLRAMRASPAHLEARRALERILKTFDPKSEAHQLAARLEVLRPEAKRERFEVRLTIERRTAGHKHARLALRALVHRTPQSPHAPPALVHLTLEAPFTGTRIVLESEAGHWRERVSVEPRSHYAITAPEVRRSIERFERAFLEAAFDLAERGS